MAPPARSGELGGVAPSSDDHRTIFRPRSEQHMKTTFIRPWVDHMRLDTVVYFVYHWLQPMPITLHSKFQVMVCCDVCTAIMWIDMHSGC